MLGRGYSLTRGYSLEVIFEEESSDFCSQLDSLEAGKFLKENFGVEDEEGEEEAYYFISKIHKENNHFNSILKGSEDTEEESFFDSFEGILNLRDMESCLIEWDEFTPAGEVEVDAEKVKEIQEDSLSLSSRNQKVFQQEISSENETRSKMLSRKQILESSGLLVDKKVMEELEEEEEEEGFVEGNLHGFSSSSNLSSSSSEERNEELLTKGEDDNTRTNTISIDIGKTLDSSYLLRDSFTERDHHLQNPSSSSSSPALTDDERNTHTLGDDESNSIYTSGNEDSSRRSSPIIQGRNTQRESSPTSSSSSTSSSDGVRNGQNENAEIHGNNNEVGDSLNSNADASPPPSLPPTDVKKVRAIFETQSNPTHNHSPRNFTLDKMRGANNPPTSTGINITSSNSFLLKKSPILDKIIQARNGSRIGKLRSAFSQMSINQLDFGDILVNENVVIEDSPDLFHQAKSRHRENSAFARRTNYCSNDPLSNSTPTQPAGSVQGKTSTLSASTASLTANPNPTNLLKRSKSLGRLEDPAESVEETANKNPSILAEELPLKNTVRNARSVFENLLSSFSIPNPQSQTKTTCSSGTTTAENKVVEVENGERGGGFGGSSNNSSSSIKNSLSSVKSNPTSKIFRSESLRNDFMMCRRYGKPILLDSSYKKPSFDKVEEKNGQLTNNSSNGPHHERLSRKFSEPISSSMSAEIIGRFERRNIGGCGSGSVASSQEDGSISEEEMSLSSSYGSNPDEEEPPRLIPPEILHRIRSCGTTITFFGGQIVSKTVKNRKLPVPNDLLSARENHSPPLILDSPNYIPETRPASIHKPDKKRNSHFPPPPPSSNQKDIIKRTPKDKVLSNSPTTAAVAPAVVLEEKSFQQEQQQTTTTKATNMTTANGRKAEGEDCVDSKDIVGDGNNSSNNVRKTFHLHFDTVWSKLSSESSNDSTPSCRIVSAIPKSPSNSPTKSPNSPIQSSYLVTMEGRNSPEGCESGPTHLSQNNNEEWIDLSSCSTPANGNLSHQQQQKKEEKTDKKGNNILNDCEPKGDNKKFSQISNGAWF